MASFLLQLKSHAHLFFSGEQLALLIRAIDSYLEAFLRLLEIFRELENVVGTPDSMGVFRGVNPADYRS